MILTNETKTLEEIKEKEEIQETHKLILWNDDVNSFQFVIGILSEVLRIDRLRAEQLAVIVDSKSRATIKEGTYDDLIPYYHKLSDNGLSLEIQ